MVQEGLLEPTESNDAYKVRQLCFCIQHFHVLCNACICVLWSMSACIGNIQVLLVV